MNRRWERALAGGLFPPSCAGCGALGPAPFCSTCVHELRRGGEVNLPGLEHVVAACVYEGPAARAIRALKYDGRSELGAPLSRILRTLLHRFDPGVAVVPVALTPARARSRGFNQSRELARGLGRQILGDALRRPHNTQRQVDSSRAARWHNLGAAFVARRETVAGRDLLLLDDVITTGATVCSAARALKDAGARSVGALAFCRALPT